MQHLFSSFKFAIWTRLPDDVIANLVALRKDKKKYITRVVPSGKKKFCRLKIDHGTWFLEEQVLETSFAFVFHPGIVYIMNSPSHEKGRRRMRKIDAEIVDSFFSFLSLRRGGKDVPVSLSEAKKSWLFFCETIDVSSGKETVYLPNMRALLLERGFVVLSEKRESVENLH